MEDEWQIVDFKRNKKRSESHDDLDILEFAGKKSLEEYREEKRQIEQLLRDIEQDDSILDEEDIDLREVKDRLTWLKEEISKICNDERKLTREINKKLECNNIYKLFDVDYDTDISIIKLQHKKLQAKYETCYELVEKLNNAFQIITDDNARNVYNTTISNSNFLVPKRGILVNMNRITHYLPAIGNIVSDLITKQDGKCTITGCQLENTVYLKNNCGKLWLPPYELVVGYALK
jgi:plasmid maintenance system antidote protein VapI